MASDEQGDRDARSEAAKRRKLAHMQWAREDYTVGWICALSTELGAAKAFLDDIHQRPNHVSDDDNDYTLGRMGGHNVVIAVLPCGEYGLSSAAIVARDMSRSFPNIKIRLMVGIGGGAPSPKNDIRLGDIAVSEPRDGCSGVFQYDFGKTTQNQGLHATGSLDQPPRRLRTAVNGLKSIYMSEGGRIKHTIESVFQREPQLRKHYQRPDPNTDRLYLSTHIHPKGDERSCSIVCHDPSLQVTWRRKRVDQDGDPVVHYGLIASANQVMKDATIRDKLAEERDVICFEMEAAGLMNNFSCLVIRGICDYSDTHKNKDWQGYAAMTAAAYAKDLLSQITPVEVVNDIGNNLNTAASIPLRRATANDVSLNEAQNEKLLESLKFEEIDSRFMNIKRAHVHTCKWILQKSEYLHWLDPNRFELHQGFLWMKGKPGAGKSTLMKFALNNIRRTKKNWVVLSFFFNARGSELESSTLGMYRSLLFQLLKQQPHLQGVFSSLDSKDWGSDSSQIWTIELLKDLFENVIELLDDAPVVTFIDALDECGEDQIRDMVGFFQRLGELASSNSIQFRTFFSSRHYPHITFSQGLSLVLEGQEGHDQDISNYINKQLMIGQSNQGKQIRDELQQKASGVFMWVVLVVDILNREHDRGQPFQRLQKKLKSIPSDLHSLFRDMLTRDYENKKELLLCIQWLLFARHPLKPNQLYDAILSGTEPTYLSSWKIEERSADDVKRFILHSSKGLAEIIGSNNLRAQFIHESVRDFLLKEDGLKTIWCHLGANFLGESHDQLRRCCIEYMDRDDIRNLTTGERPTRREIDEQFPLLQYSIQNIMYHAEGAQSGGIDQGGFLQNFKHQNWLELLNLVEQFKVRRHNLTTSLLYVLAEHNKPALIKARSWTQSGFEIEDERYGLPFIAALATKSHEAAEALLDAIARRHPENSCIRTLSKRFSESKLEYKIFTRDLKILPSKGIMGHAAELGDKLIYNILLSCCEEGIVANNKTDRSPLCIAAECGHVEIVELLLDMNVAEVNTAVKRGRDSGRTPLSISAEQGHEQVVKLLINTNRVKVDSFGSSVDDGGRTPLSFAAEEGHVGIVQMLLDTGMVNPDSKAKGRYNSGRTPLSFAAGKGHVGIVQMLLDTGMVNPDSKAKGQYISGRTPLSFAARLGHEKIVQMLLETEKVNIDSKSTAYYGDGITPLMFAAREGHMGIVQMLLDTGKVNPDSKAEGFPSGRTPLSFAAEMGHKKVVQMLLETGKVDINSKGVEHPSKQLCTPLSFATKGGHKEICQILLESGAKELQ